MEEPLVDGRAICWAGMEEEAVAERVTGFITPLGEIFVSRVFTRPYFLGDSLLPGVSVVSISEALAPRETVRGRREGEDMVDEA